MAGTEGDLLMANYVAQKFISYGLEHTKIETLPATLSFPKDERPNLELIDYANPDKPAIVFKASLAEPILPEDPTSDSWLRNHTFLGFSPSGEVMASIVYANYGSPDDFDELQKLGVDINGKIVLVRYGRLFRGLKVSYHVQPSLPMHIHIIKSTMTLFLLLLAQAMNAEARGAIGTIIYSDPQDDGYVQGQTFPDGPWRPSFGVQRGSASFLSKCAGDPNRAASPYSVEELCGYSFDELVPQHPVLPISYGDAEPLLRSLGGVPAPDFFQGGLDLIYRTGPTKDGMMVRLKVSNPKGIQSPLGCLRLIVTTIRYRRTIGW